MTTESVSSGLFDPDTTRKAIDIALEDFLTQKKGELEQTRMAGFPDLVAEFLEGGKRIRPLLALAGWQASGGEAGTEAVIRVAAALEMFHAFALIHDDVMDSSDTRRGRPTVHRTLAGTRRDRHDESFGTSAAILVGDLVFSWSDELLHFAGLSPDQLHDVFPLVSRMRTEVMLGQYLDLQATGELTDDIETTLVVNRFKTAKYTVERPLHIGAALAGAGPQTLAACTAYAMPLGEAFQLRDDLLGVYGDVRETGKSRLDDLRAAKSTTLVALALRACDADQAARLRALVGDPQLDADGLEEILAVFAATGAADAVESMIHDRYDQALRALETAPFAPAAITTLKHFARTAIWRNS